MTKADASKPRAWTRFEDQPNIGAEGGSVVAGLTNQYAHKGTQSLFIEASKLSVPYLGARFVTRPIPIEGGKYYKTSLWGRNDPQKPLIAAMAQLFLKVQIEFFTDEGKTETGDTQYLLQPLPGGKGTHADSSDYRVESRKHAFCCAAEREIHDCELPLRFQRGEGSHQRDHLF